MMTETRKRKNPYAQTIECPKGYEFIGTNYCFPNSKDTNSDANWSLGLQVLPDPLQTNNSIITKAWAALKDGPLGPSSGMRWDYDPNLTPYSHLLPPADVYQGKMWDVRKEDDNCWTVSYDSTNKQGPSDYYNWGPARTSGGNTFYAYYQNSCEYSQGNFADIWTQYIDWHAFVGWAYNQPYSAESYSADFSLLEYKPVQLSPCSPNPFDKGAPLCPGVTPVKPPCFPPVDKISTTLSAAFSASLNGFLSRNEGTAAMVIPTVITFATDITLRYFATDIDEIVISPLYATVSSPLLCGAISSFLTSTIRNENAKLKIFLSAAATNYLTNVFTLQIEPSVCNS